MPELPEVEITARRLDEALASATIESAIAPASTAEDRRPAAVGDGSPHDHGRAAHLTVDLSGDLVLLAHLMSAGRMQLTTSARAARDRTSRLLVRVDPALCTRCCATSA